MARACERCRVWLGLFFPLAGRWCQPEQLPHNASGAGRLECFSLPGGNGGEVTQLTSRGAGKACDSLFRRLFFRQRQHTSHVFSPMPTRFHLAGHNP